MGWGRMLLLGNVGQQLDIGDLNENIAQMQAECSRNRQIDQTQAKSIEELQRENQNLKVYLATLMKLLVSKGVLKPEEIETVVRAIETEK